MALQSTNVPVPFRSPARYLRGVSLDDIPVLETHEPAEAMLDLPVALAVPPGAGATADDEGARALGRSAAARLFETGPVIVVHAALTARRLGLSPPVRSAALLDALELYAFVRPAKFCAPSAAGLSLALGLPEPVGAPAQATALREACRLLLEELAANPVPTREEALQLAEGLARAGWSWGVRVVGALRSQPIRDRAYRGSGFDAWTRLAEWEDQAPAGEIGSHPIDADATRVRLAELLNRAGLDEARPSQATFSAEASEAFQPRDKDGAPRVVLAEAGTGVGKTLGYLAPASLFAEKNGPAVWISTYTRALQRQIDRESAALYPDPEVRAKKAVVRKGRENYLCLLNFQDMAQASALGTVDTVGVGLVARWVGASRDGDMTGGDFPAWLPTLFSTGSSQGQMTPQNLVDRRGECVHAACPHYRICFVEKAIRASRKADIVIANHALVLTQAAFDGARAMRGLKTDGETTALKRVVFDEGHHLFDAADSAFSACLSGQETAELRRWLRGPEGRGRRGRGLEQRLGDLVGDREDARQALNDAMRGAAQLPGEGWSGRIAPASGEINPIGPIEQLLAAAREQLMARSESRAGDHGQECLSKPATDAVLAAAPAAARALAAIEAPLLALARALEDLLDDESAELETGERARIEGALRGLDRRARMTLPSWRSMLQALADESTEPDPDFVDWFSTEMMFGRVVDAALRRHWVDPTIPLEAAVIAPAHGVLVTSATLTDPALDDAFELARLRTGSSRLAEPPKQIRVESPFDYASQARVLVVNDIGRDDPRQVAAAMRELFLASGGGALGLFTAIRRLRTVYELLAPPLAEKGLSLYAQHVDPLEVGALVDVFRAEEHSCLLGTDAVRDGVDVPGRALRLIAFDRVPWPRPDLLHKARRARFGGKGYDDALARARVAQAFGRLIRRADDKGVFVLLDAAAPTRLFASLPPGIEVQRVGLVEAIDTVRAFLNPDS
jgi:ATP-dependent DNA helicase DinG